MLKGSDLKQNTDLMIENELKHARKIQADLSPKKPLDDNNIRINAFINPSRVVCGDFYDYFKINDNKYGLVIADASGKGMPAAILISQIQAILKSELDSGTSIESVIDKMNKHLVANSNARNFTSIFYGIYDVSNKKIEYVNAGHNCPILVLSDGSFKLLKTTCPALGLLKDLNILTSTLSVQSESILMCYTDGVTETMNKVEEQFGEGRLIELIINNRNLDPDNIIELVETGLNNFRSKKFIKDDRTIVVAKIK